MLLMIMPMFSREQKTYAVVVIQEIIILYCVVDIKCHISD
jgi:hypothetical protein